MRWHDHQQFTAADVVFTYETMISPKTPTAYGGDFKFVESVEAVDPYTVRVRYKHPSAKALQSWSIWMLPKHLLASYAREGKLREADAVFFARDPARVLGGVKESIFVYDVRIDYVQHAMSGWLHLARLLRER